MCYETHRSEGSNKKASKGLLYVHGGFSIWGGHPTQKNLSYVWTLEGWLYPAVVMDLFSRQIVGWTLDKRIKKQLTLDALAMAYWRRKPVPGFRHQLGLCGAQTIGIHPITK